MSINDLIHTNARHAYDQGRITELQNIIEYYEAMKGKPDFTTENLIHFVKSRLESE